MNGRSLAEFLGFSVTEEGIECTKEFLKVMVLLLVEPWGLHSVFQVENFNFYVILCRLKTSKIRQGSSYHKATSVLIFCTT